jgi:tRNA threonylcarbamoyladenosine biosynthesis protein TsaE
MQSHLFESETKLMQFASDFAKTLKGNEVLALSGDLGCGKTTFVKGLVAGLEIPATVTSPTFNLVHRYSSSKFNVIHYDLYRLKKLSEIEALDLESEIENRTHILAIEWPNLVESILPQERTNWLTFEEFDKGRRVTIRSVKNPL